MKKEIYIDMDENKNRTSEKRNHKEKTKKDPM
jgi:hypothetical protein